MRLGAQLIHVGHIGIHTLVNLRLVIGVICQDGERVAPRNGGRIESIFQLQAAPLLSWRVCLAAFSLRFARPFCDGVLSRLSKTHCAIVPCLL
jgi:hypothetical protein